VTASLDGNHHPVLQFHCSARSQGPTAASHQPRASAFHNRLFHVLGLDALLCARGMSPFWLASQPSNDTLSAQIVSADFAMRRDSSGSSLLVFGRVLPRRFDNAFDGRQDSSKRRQRALARLIQRPARCPSQTANRTRQANIRVRNQLAWKSISGIP
jgi:hypothetical protein